MEVLDFDTPIDRTGTASVKWGRYPDKDILPMWVADMDFRSPGAVIRALKARADHGIFGYTDAPAELVDAAVRRLATKFDWSVKPEWILWLPGVVTGLNIACRAVGDPGDEVLIMTPVYPPFFTAPKNMDRKCIPVPLSEDEGFWRMDLDALEAAVTPRTRMIILCNPHNPVGRVFTRRELDRLAAFCHRHNLTVCSDEIHCDLILDPDKIHQPFATLDANTALRSITLMAPSKTYNIPGLGCSFAVIPDPELKNRFRKSMAGIVPDVNLMGYSGALAAYRDGEPWLSALLSYLRDSRDFLVQEMETLPGLRMAPVEATYLAWIDTRDTGIASPAAFFENAGVGLSDGKYFGLEKFVRLNFGCSREVIREAVDRMRTALGER